MPLMPQPDCRPAPALVTLMSVPKIGTTDRTTNVVTYSTTPSFGCWQHGTGLAVSSFSATATPPLAQTEPSQHLATSHSTKITAEHPNNCAQHRRSGTDDVRLFAATQ